MNQKPGKTNETAPDANPLPGAPLDAPNALDDDRSGITRRERRPFPFWTLLVIALCTAVWAYGVRLFRQGMAAYEDYEAVRATVSQSTFFPGVSVDGTDLGGMTPEQAQSLYADRQQAQTQAFSLVVASGERRWLITPNEVPLLFDGQTVLERAYAVGRTGTLAERYEQITRTAREGAAFTTGFEYDRTAIGALVDIIADSLDVPVTNATLDAFDVQTHLFSFTEATPGYQVDRQALEADILAALDEGAYDRVIVPKGSAVEPTVTREQLWGLFGRISSFSTTTTNDRDRNTNIALSADALNGRVVMPGETLSFNDCTGKRTGEKGYREAGAIAGGVLVDDTGGGVCQTSSTLFNAVVRANLTIVRRYAHSWPSSYVNKGEDATVNWPSRDFIFRNDGQYPVFLIAWYADNQVTVEIYGQMLEDGMSIDLRSETVKTVKPSDEVLYTLDETLPVGTRKAGRRKRTGYVVDTYKVYKNAAGEVIRQEKLWTTTYPATQNEILYH